MENTVEKNKFPTILSNFILKIIALLTMTLDHVGYMMQDYSMCLELAQVFRVCGRLALPLFCFMIVEGVLHTKNFPKYVLRLGICLVCVSAALLVVEYAPLFDGFSVRNEGNIFIDLLLGAIAVFCLNHKKIWVKFLAILPIAFAIGSSITVGYECVSCGREVWIIPFFLRTQYGWYGVLLILGFYAAYKLSDLYIKIFTKDVYKGTRTEKISQNICAVLMLGVVNLILYTLSFVIEPSYLNYLDVELEMCSMLAGILILLYNGKRGYGAPWFKYGCYVYYALHMVIIYGLFALLA